MPEQVETSWAREERLATVRIDAPPGNILTTRLARALRGELAALGERRALRLVLLEGAGPDFSYGASIQEHAAGQIEQLLPEMHRLVVDLLELPVPTAAVVRGRCLGGGLELALACDFVFAAANATLGLPEVGLAGFPPVAAAILPLKVGYSRATRAILTGERQPASAWHESGVVTAVTPASQLSEFVNAWFDAELSGHSAEGLRYATRAARLGLLRHVRSVLPDLEHVFLTQLMRSADPSEAVAAFLEKRQPHWSR